ncbi:hypothetical protein TWF506_008210 [Arthrobotrys conoides]|uniref:Uncharacterized protein n=1 Tax=Arthrobotrys conoides TaxID=74498 RepID=A0AAN8NVH2_9PEZI
MEGSMTYNAFTRHIVSDSRLRIRAPGAGVGDVPENSGDKLFEDDRIANLALVLAAGDAVRRRRGHHSCQEERDVSNRPGDAYIVIPTPRARIYPPHAGFDNLSRFHDMDDLPPSWSEKNNIPKVKSLRLYYDPLENGIISLKSYELEHTTGQVITNPPGILNTRLYFPSTEICLDEDEYIDTCRYGMQPAGDYWHSFEVVTDFMVQTSKGRVLAIGELNCSWDFDIIAPPGYAMAGFHGYGIDVPVLETGGAYIASGGIACLGCIFAKI